MLQTRARAGENPSLDCANWVNNFSAALASGFSSELNRRGAQSCQLLHFDEELMRLCSHRFLSPERGGENIREKGALVPFSFDMQMTDTATICFPSNGARERNSDDDRYPIKNLAPLQRQVCIIHQLLLLYLLPGRVVDMQLTSRDKTPAARCLLYTRVSRYLRVVQEHTARKREAELVI